MARPRALFYLRKGPPLTNRSVIVKILHLTHVIDEQLRQGSFEHLPIFQGKNID